MKHVFISALFLSALLTACSKSVEELKDLKELRDLELAAQRGDAEAQYRWGEHCLLVSDIDDTKGIAWLMRAAEQGHGMARFSLGVIYEYGFHGTVVDPIEAAMWYKKAAESYQQLAEQGDMTAQFRLAALYKSGKGVPQDAAKADEWNKKAAEQLRVSAEEGDVKSQFRLAGRYEEGKGVPQDIDEAIEWYKKAAAQGDEDARYRLRILQNQRKHMNERRE